MGWRLSEDANLAAAPLAQSLSSRPSERGQRGGAAGMPWRLRRSRHLTQLASRFVSRLASQQCTQTPQSGAERPDPPICVHSCVPTSVHNSATVYTNAPKRCGEAVFGDLCTLLRPRVCPQQRNSATVYTNAPKRRREAIFGDLCTLLRPRVCPQQRSSATVYTNAPKRRRETILANLCTLLRHRPGGDAHVALVVTQLPTHTNSRSFF